jgi:hypothetical protein
MFILPPNCIVPSATSLTMRPVFPSFLILHLPHSLRRSGRHQIDTFESTWPGQNWALMEWPVNVGSGRPCRRAEYTPGEAAGPADPAPSSMGVQAPPAHPPATINSRPSRLLRRKEVDLPRERRPTCPEAFPLSILAMGRSRDSVSVLAAETLGEGIGERFAANGPKDSRHEFRATIGRGAARRGEVASGSVARIGSQRRCDSSTTASINTGLSPALFADAAGRA